MLMENDTLVGIEEHFCLSSSLRVFVTFTTNIRMNTPGKTDSLYQECQI